MVMKVVLLFVSFHFMNGWMNEWVIVQSNVAFCHHRPPLCSSHAISKASKQATCFLLPYLRFKYVIQNTTRYIKAHSILCSDNIKAELVGGGQLAKKTRYVIHPWFHFLLSFATYCCCYWWERRNSGSILGINGWACFFWFLCNFWYVYATISR